MKKHSSQGFTLIEILIVLGVVAVLAAILTPNLLAARQKATAVTNRLYVRNVITSVETFRDFNGKLTPSSSIACDSSSGTYSAPAKPPAVTSCTALTSASGDDYVINVLSGSEYFTYSSRTGLTEVAISPLPAP